MYFIVQFISAGNAHHEQSFGKADQSSVEIGYTVLSIAKNCFHLSCKLGQLLHRQSHITATYFINFILYCNTYIHTYAEFHIVLRSCIIIDTLSRLLI